MEHNKWAKYPFSSPFLAMQQFLPLQCFTSIRLVTVYSTRKVAASVGSPCPTALDSSPLGVDPFRAQRTGLESSLRPYVASKDSPVMAG
ncbi:hypothetical protein THAOC_10274 [Thalassiosira oceanica]|uniref:Uncharacterized protein n=1 Tax=Thalassiosira oceanica TaxID=159749 RepID=K0SUA1_THAOC|nr:hypothetical protein THAOC_10274 [Thalassiosira oceanica]|eukprot:EJK68534.1 hypothetical protein THAOC_10274 [Thalassiosira oceanica]